MKIICIAALCIPILSSSCSNRTSESAYCKAILSNYPTKAVSVRHLYVYGTVLHGSMAISSECINPTFNFTSLQIKDSGNADIRKRIKEFNAATYNKPSKRSGMFEFDGIVDVIPNEKLVLLVNVNRFSEVDEEESRKILDELHANE